MSDHPEFVIEIRSRLTEAEHNAIQDHFRAGLSQHDLAERTGLTQPCISYIEAGNRHPMPGTLLRIVAALGTEEQFMELIDHVYDGIDEAICIHHAKNAQER